MVNGYDFRRQQNIDRELQEVESGLFALRLCKVSIPPTRLEQANTYYGTI